jgi:hypothetical protein
MSDISILELIRVKTPENKVHDSGKANKFFDVLSNSQNLTEEFLYAHQPVTNKTISIYATSEKAIGRLDSDIADQFTLIEGSAIVVARKGYAGRLFVIEDDKFIVHEDAYPIKPKDEFKDKINLDWFALHYNEEFQANRTSAWGIGDFPRTRFKNMQVVIPEISFQNKVAKLYLSRKEYIESIKDYELDVFSEMDRNIEKMIGD